MTSPNNAHGLQTHHAAFPELVTMKGRRDTSKRGQVARAVLAGLFGHLSRCPGLPLRGQFDLLPPCPHSIFPSLPSLVICKLCKHAHGHMRQMENRMWAPVRRCFCWRFPPGICETTGTVEAAVPRGGLGDISSSGVLLKSLAILRGPELCPGHHLCRDGQSWTSTGLSLSFVATETFKDTSDLRASVSSPVKWAYCRTTSCHGHLRYCQSQNIKVPEEWPCVRSLGSESNAPPRGSPPGARGGSPSKPTAPTACIILRESASIFSETSLNLNAYHFAPSSRGLWTSQQLVLL